ncbi:MAG: hypothetical protein AAF843_20795 [Bacteroidota bacterium]
MARRMNADEQNFIEEHVIKLVTGNKEGVSIETILDYLDYTNRVRYDEKDINPILNKLISDQIIYEDQDLYLAK